MSSSNASAVLLATVAVLPGHSAVLTADLRAKLKSVLELPGASVAVTGSGEYLAIFDKPAAVVDAAANFLRACSLLTPIGGNEGAFAGKVAIDAWPHDDEVMPVERVREVMAHGQAHTALITENCVQLLPPAARRNLMSCIGAGSIPALADVLELSWRDDDVTYRESTRQIGISASAPKRTCTAIAIVRRDKTVTVQPSDCPFSIGRDSTCSLTLGGPNVSRRHGVLEHDGNKFYFRDESRNGTFIQSGGEEIHVHNERFLILSAGVISPGVTLVEQTGEVLRYTCLY